MAQYKKIYENNIEKHEITFREEVFDFSMIEKEDSLDRESVGKDFSYQIHEKFTDVSINDLENTGVDDLWWETDEAGIFEILKNLEELE